MVVGGFDKVYELGRIQMRGYTKHNPEFTSVEIYQAFSICVMDLTENL